MFNYPSPMFKAYLASPVYNTNILQTAVQELVFRWHERRSSQSCMLAQIR